VSHGRAVDSQSSESIALDRYQANIQNVCPPTVPQIRAMICGTAKGTGISSSPGQPDHGMSFGSSPPLRLRAIHLHLVVFLKALLQNSRSEPGVLPSADIRPPDAVASS
jgi:hypothetical protein